RTGVAEVVEVVAGLRRVRAVGAEAGDRAEDGRRRQLDAESLPDARAESLEHDVRLQELRRRRLAARIPRQHALPIVQRSVPAGGGSARRVALGRLDL